MFSWHEEPGWSLFCRANIIMSRSGSSSYITLYCSIRICNTHSRLGPYTSMPSSSFFKCLQVILSTATSAKKGSAHWALCRSGSSPATAAVKAEGKWTPFWVSRLQTSCKCVFTDKGSQRCCIQLDVFSSRRRKAALVNRPHRVLWKRGSTRRASHKGVNDSAIERINNWIITLKIHKYARVCIWHLAC